jgi:hypothetical protein
MRVEERHYDNGHVQVVVRTDDYREVATLDVKYDAAMHRHDRYTVRTDVRKRAGGGIRTTETALVQRSPFQSRDHMKKGA